MCWKEPPLESCPKYKEHSVDSVHTVQFCPSISLVFGLYTVPALPKRSPTQQRVKAFFISQRLILFFDSFFFFQASGVFSLTAIKAPRPQNLQSDLSSPNQSSVQCDYSRHPLLLSWSRVLVVNHTYNESLAG